MRIWIVKSWSLIHVFDISDVMLVIYVDLRLHVDCDDIRSFTLTYPVACLYIVCGLLYCDDHQP